MRFHRKLAPLTPARSATGGLTLPNKPSIAVLVSDNMSSDREQEYFADGVVEDIITALSRFAVSLSSLGTPALPIRANR